MATVRLLVSLAENAPEAIVDVCLDAPDGTKLGSIALTTEALAAAEQEIATDGTVWYWIQGGLDIPISGLHGVYFVFRASSDELIGSFDQFSFSR